MNREKIIRIVLKAVLFWLKRNPMRLRWFLKEAINHADTQTLASLTFGIKGIIKRG